MITFSLSILALLAGYFFYSRLVERVFVIDPNKATPAITMADGVDYVTTPAWKIFLIQFLNIAGLGPIFGAVAGAMWGPVADRKSVVSGQSVSVRVDLGGRRLITHKKTTLNSHLSETVTILSTKSYDS